MPASVESRVLTRSVSSGALQPRNSDNLIYEWTESKRQYTLDRDKALDKKLQKCDAQHIIFEMKSGKNFVMRLSTSAYELAKTQIKDILQSPDLIGQFGIQAQIGKDSANANTDTCLKVYNRKQNGAVGNIPKFTINFYHTTNTITVNGSKVDVFINNIFDKLCESIKSKHPQLDIANATIASQINSLRTISTSYTVQSAIESTPDENELVLKSLKYQMNDNDNPDQMNTDNSVIEELAFCPYCDQEVTVQGIFCVECESWLHYECVNLNPETVSNAFKDTEYVCNQCNEDTLYGNSQPGCNDIVHVEDSTINGQSRETINEWNTPSAKSASGTSPKQLLVNSTPNVNSQFTHNVPTTPKAKLDTTTYPNMPPGLIGQSTDSLQHKLQFASEVRNPPVIQNNLNPPQSPKPRRPLHKRPCKSDKGKTGSFASSTDATIILAQKTKILDLENEIKQLKNAIESIKSHAPQGTSQHHNLIGPQNINPIYSQVDNNTLQHIRHEQLEGRLRMLEHQVVQNMCISTAITTQLALQVNMGQQRVKEQVPQNTPTAVGYPNYLPAPPFIPSIYPGIQGVPPFMARPTIPPPSYMHPGLRPAYHSFPQTLPYQSFNPNIHNTHHYGQQSHIRPPTVPNVNEGGTAPYVPEFQHPPRASSSIRNNHLYTPLQNASIGPDFGLTQSIHCRKAEVNPGPVIQTTNGKDILPTPGACDVHPYIGKYLLSQICNQRSINPLLLTDL